MWTRAKAAKSLSDRHVVACPPGPFRLHRTLPAIPRRAATKSNTRLSGHCSQDGNRVRLYNRLGDLSTLV